MKKTITVIAVFLSISCFWSCGSKVNNKYSSLVINSANDEYSVSSETDYWTGEYYEKSNMGKTICSVQETEYKGSYIRSISDVMNSYVTDIYRDPNNIEFGLRSDTGELAYINFMNASFFDTEPYLDEVISTQQDAVSFAKEIADEYLNDIDSYVLYFGEPVTRFKERDGKTYELTYYFITFIRKINGYDTSDRIDIKVTSKGHIASIKLGDIGVFDDFNIEYESDKVKTSISKKIDGLYAKHKLTDIEYDISKQTLVVTPSGDVCIMSEIKLTGSNDTNDKVNTAVMLLTILG